ncbi:thioesterase family protein [Streptomyces sp. P38-E01]|uniref:Thioesterase family protein n=1 Tax=Streptomyces tardus TaxID=2780544 RepID=A0A949JH91_9ACTN|nr:thioesterase family protein [Streptomyces tardus]MBU7596229.1 thioesterase family protein [Streptomyces tardus]
MTQATIGSSEFDRDTRVRLRTDGVFDADLPEGWSVGAGLNGGYLLALLGRALGEALERPDPFTITAHYLSGTTPGPAVIRTDVAARRHSTATGSARLLQPDADGNEVERVRVLGTCGDLSALPADVHTTAKPPEIPPWEHCVGAEHSPHDAERMPPIVHRLRLRLDPATLGWAIGEPSGKGEMRAWFALPDGRDHDPLSLLLAVDGLPSVAFELGIDAWVPTVELTAHVRARPAPGPVRVALTTRNVAGGYLEEDAEVWDSEDRLVAQSRQLAKIKPKPSHFRSQ